MRPNEPLWVRPLIATGLAAIVLVAMDAGGPIRTLFVAAFSLLGPGAGIIRILRLDTPIERLALIVPLSLACTALVATAALYLGWWSPLLILAVLVFGSSVMLLFPDRVPAAPRDA
jgi:hypothetical protein